VRLVLVALTPVALVLALAGGCERKQPEVAGIGKWRFTTSTLKDAMASTVGVCQPTELTDGRKATWCFQMPPYKVANRTAEVDLYFDGTEPSSKLIEIQLKVRGCVEQDLESWMRAAFGPAIETKATRGYWKNSFLWAAALMPSAPGRCTVHLLPLSENAEIERIKQR
jgi:hypothetical protein